MRKTGKPISAIALSRPMTTILGALFALALMLVLPSPAHAQSDAIRVMAGRVLGERVLDDARRDRAGDIRRDDRRDEGRYENRRADNRRDVQRIRKERQAREKFCRKNPRERVCREWFGYDHDVRNRRDNNAAWCWDRNRDGRCDAGSANRRFPGRGVAIGRR